MPKKGLTWVTYDRDGVEMSHKLDPADYFKVWCFITDKPDTAQVHDDPDPTDDSDGESIGYCTCEPRTNTRPCLMPLSHAARFDLAPQEHG